MRGGKYRAYINFQKKQYHLGTYETFETAIKARKEAEKQIHKKFLEWYSEEYPEKWAQINKKGRNEPV